MYLAAVVLRGDQPGARTDVTGVAVTDALWQLARPADGIEHIMAREMSGDIMLAIYLQGRNEVRARRAAFVFCERAVAQVPILQGFRVLAQRAEEPGAVGALGDT